MTIFVFGSNRAGRHGRGAARTALFNHGAKYGQGEGLQGSSYAIPTKDENLRTLPVPEIEKHVKKFIQFAKRRTDLTFMLTPIGCGLAGHSPSHIARLFADAPANVVLPDEFKKNLQERND